jgi:hypothetical protein
VISTRTKLTVRPPAFTCLAPIAAELQASGARGMRAIAAGLQQGNRVKERMLNPIEQFVAHSGVWDSHGAKLWSAAQSLGFMLCVPSTTHSAADGSASIHPIALRPAVP